MLLCMTMNGFPAFLLMVFSIAAVEGNQQYKATIFQQLRKPLNVGDRVVLTGVFPRRPMMVRFFSSSFTCNGMKRSTLSTRVPCQPLVLKFKPFRKMVVAYYKGAVHTYNDVMLRREPSHQIQWEAPFTLVIQVHHVSYEVKLNGELLMDVPDMIGHNKIHEIRSYGGRFKQLYVQRNGKNPR